MWLKDKNILRELFFVYNKNRKDVVQYRHKRYKQRKKQQKINS